jgi:hypothetical protein
MSYGTAGDLVTLVRSQVNDVVAPVRHTDATILQWLSDGQRLVAKWVPEAFAATGLYTPALGSAFQRLNPDVAYGLIRVEQNYSAAGAAYGRVVRLVAREVYDSFDPGWMTRTPDPVPAAGTYFDGFCLSPDDPLGFYLHPMPSVADARVSVTYVGSPVDYAAVGDTVLLSYVYHDALVNYAMYRAATSHTASFSKPAAERAAIRFAQQLKLSRETLLAMIGDAHRVVEQQV